MFKVSLTVQDLDATSSTQAAEMFRLFLADGGPVQVIVTSDDGQEACEYITISAGEGPLGK